MNQNFSNLLTKLEVDQYAGLSVFDLDNFKKIINATCGTELKNKYGSVKNFVEHLHKEGITNFQVQEYRKNGSAFKKIGDTFKVSFSEKTQNNMQQNNTGLGLAGLQGIGLGFADIMNLHTDSNLKVRLEVENKFLKEENENLKKEKETLKEQILQDRFNENKTSGNKDLIKELAVTFAPLLQGVMTKSNPAGLNAPQLSPEKQQLVSIIQDQAFSSDMAIILLNVYQAINTKEGFYEKLEKIIEE